MKDSVAGLSMTCAHLLDWFHLDFKALKAKVPEDVLAASEKLQAALAEKERARLLVSNHPRNFCYLQTYRKKLRECITVMATLMPKPPVTLEEMFASQRSAVSANSNRAGRKSASKGQQVRA